MTDICIPRAAFAAENKSLQWFWMKASPQNHFKSIENWKFELSITDDESKVFNNYLEGYLADINCI